jgi:abortive infection bacteriophage resistance protein
MRSRCPIRSSSVNHRKRVRCHAKVAQKSKPRNKRLEFWGYWWHHITNVAATPLLGQPSDAPIWRLFLFVDKYLRLPIIHRRKYDKPALTFGEQVEKLESRGLVISDRTLATRWLEVVSYYRFSAYLHTYRILGSDNYRAGTTFEEIADVYNFDRKLRMVVMDAIERVEVWFRAAITYELAHRFGPFGYVQRSSFDSKFNHRRLITELRDEHRRSKEEFIEHYFQKYTGENHLPIWMATELLTFGSLNFIYASMPQEMRKRIAFQIGVDDSVLTSWIKSMYYLRNLCAHHGRLWNRQLGISPKIPHEFKKYYGRLVPRKTYTALAILGIILNRVSPDSTWKASVATLIKANPQINLRQMGFPADWQSRLPFGDPTPRMTLTTEIARIPFE